MLKSAGFYYSKEEMLNMYFTYGPDRAYENMMRTTPGFECKNDCCSEREVCYCCDFYRPFWYDRYCVYKVCPFQSGRSTFKKKHKRKRRIS